MIPLSLLYLLADDSPLKGLWNMKSVPEKLADLGIGKKHMSAPKLALHDRVQASGDRSGTIISVRDFGNSAPPQYDVRLDDGKEELFDEAQLVRAVTVEPAQAAAASADSPAPSTPKRGKSTADTATEGDAAPAESAS